MSCLSAFARGVVKFGLILVSGHVAFHYESQFGFDSRLLIVCTITFLEPEDSLETGIQSAAELLVASDEQLDEQLYQVAVEKF